MFPFCILIFPKMDRKIESLRIQGSLCLNEAGRGDFYEVKRMAAKLTADLVGSSCHN